jgi:prophage maintenance system killer protein
MFDILEKSTYRSNFIIKCKQLYEDLRSLEKHNTQTSELYKNRETTFNEDLNDFFDIAAANVLNLIKIKKTQHF